MWAVYFKLYSGHVRWHCQTVLFYFVVSITASSSLLVSLGFFPHSRGHTSYSWLKIRRHPSALLQARRSWLPSCFHFAEELLLYSQIGLYPSNVSYFRWAHDIVGVWLYHSCCSFVHFQCLPVRQEMEASISSKSFRWSRFEISASPIIVMLPLFLLCILESCSAPSFVYSRRSRVWWSSGEWS